VNAPGLVGAFLDVVAAVVVGLLLPKLAVGLHGAAALFVDRCLRPLGGGRDRKLPRVMFHALRHSHASALIAAGLDIVTVSRRLGHGSPAITLGVYAHIFTNADAGAALAIEAAMGAGAKSPM
jgi:integrase